MHESLTEWWNGISLRTKITGVTVLLLTLGLAVSGIGTMAMLKPYMIGQLDAQLKAVSQAQDLRVFFDQGDQEDGDDVVLSTREDYYIAVYDSEGRLTDHNWRGKPAALYPALPDSLDLLSVMEMNADDTVVQTYRSNSGSEEFRAVAVTVTINPQGSYGTAVIAVSTTPTENVLAAYLAIFLGFGTGVVVVGALLTRMLVTSTFGPLREVERTAAAIADGDFGQRLGNANPDTEVGRLNRSLNTMLSRIDRAFNDRARTIEQMRRFVGDASHELRTPLVSVRGYAELYRMGALQRPEDVAQAMDRIEKEAIRMGGLVEDLLELARLDETKPLALAPVDLVPLARDAAMDAMASSPHREVRVVLSTIRAAEPGDDLEETQEMDLASATRGAGAAAGMTGPIQFATARLQRLRRRSRKVEVAEVQTVKPGVAVATEPPSEATVLAEENKIRQVITNLMGNAMRFTAPDSPIEIGVVVDETSRTASVEVIDHGEGIPPQIRDKIFQRFWRADTSRTRETGGSGLGLAIVSSITAMHQGTVDVVDTEGGGATFRVTLPLMPRPSDAPGSPDSGKDTTPERRDATTGRTDPPLTR